MTRWFANRSQGKGGGIPKKLISIADSINLSSIQEYLFVQGKSFSYEDYLLFGSSETKTLVFDPTAFAGTNMVFNPIAFGANAGPILIDFYYGTEADDDGELLGVSNRRAPLGITNKGIWSLNPSNISLGTRFSGDMVPANETIGQTAIGASNNPGLPFEIFTNTKYALTIENKNGAGVYVQMKATWFES
jgi:hypothetical protein